MESPLKKISVQGNVGFGGDLDLTEGFEPLETGCSWSSYCKKKNKKSKLNQD